MGANPPSPFSLPNTGAEIIGNEDPKEVKEITQVKDIKRRGRTGVETLSGNAPPPVSEKGVKILSKIDHQVAAGMDGRETKITPGA